MYVKLLDCAEVHDHSPWFRCFISSLTNNLDSVRLKTWKRNSGSKSGSHLPDPLFDPLFRFHVFNLTLSRLFVNEEMVQRNQGEWSCTSAQSSSLTYMP